MPWKIYAEDGMHCVHKLNEDESKGKKVKCFESEKEAKNHMAALYASEESDMKKSADVADSDNVGVDAVGETDQDQEPTNSSDSFNTEGSDPGPAAAKAMSYNEIIRAVGDAWYEHNDYVGYVKDVYPDYVIIRVGKQCYKVPYTQDGESYSFAANDQWQKVEMKKEWVEKGYTVKALGENRVGAYGVLWGDENSKDLHGEYFTKDTEELKAIFDAMGAVPWLFHHAADNTIKSTVVGIVDVMEIDEVGLWYEAKIKEHELYKQYVKPLIDQRALYSSSGTLPGAKRVTKSGKIKRWPIAEMTGTHIPAEWRMLDRPIDQIKSAYKSVGINTDFENFANEDASEGEADTEGTEKVRKTLEAQLYQRKAELELLELDLVSF